MTSLLETPFAELLAVHPATEAFFGEMGLATPRARQSPASFFAELDSFTLADCGMDAIQLGEHLCAFVERLESLAEQASRPLQSLTILGGHAKSGEPEELHLEVHPGEITCIVGPTGSGKSRLLEDIEYLAQGDTPTGRRILVDGGVPSDLRRFSAEQRLVARLSQGMTFVMDLAVCDFLTMHAQSRMVAPQQTQALVERVIARANELAGEPILPTTTLTQLSGGQSRALMIADVALIGSAPIVLVDEIENAGVDRRRALELLTGADKIVFVVTHDPLIAMLGTRRLAIENGRVRRVLEPCAAERQNAQTFMLIDGLIDTARTRIRAGEEIVSSMEEQIRAVLRSPQ